MLVIIPTSSETVTFETSIMIILEIPIENWWKRVNQSCFKTYIKVIYIFIILFILAIVFKSKFYIQYLGITLSAFLIVFIFFKLPYFNTYLFKIELENENLIIHYYKYNKVIKHSVKVKNFKVKSSSNPKGPPFFIIEQKKPYKLLLFQACYGYWEDKEKINILLTYAG